MIGDGEAVRFTASGVERIEHGTIRVDLGDLRRVRGFLRCIRENRAYRPSGRWHLSGDREVIFLDDRECTKSLMSYDVDGIIRQVNRTTLAVPDAFVHWRPDSELQERVDEEGAGAVFATLREEAWQEDRHP